MVKHWNTAEVIARLSAISTDGIGRLTVKKCGQGGDVDTDNLEVTCEAWKESEEDQATLFIRGFVTGSNNPDVNITNPGDCDIELVELTDGSGEGGLESDDEAAAILYSRIKATLRKMGYDVVRSLKECF